MRTVLLTSMIGMMVCTAAPSPAHAERRKKAERSVHSDPATSAGEIPVLAAILNKTGWLPTPELSGGFKPGDIFAVTEQGHQWQGEGCFPAEARISTYTATEVVSQLQVGVSTPVAGADVGIHKKVKFGTPMHEALPGLSLHPTQACLSSLRNAARTSDLSDWYLVKEVLRAEITEQTCGRLDAKGAFNPLVQADASLSTACSMGSLEPVAVAYRIVPVKELIEAEPAASQPPAASLADPESKEGLAETENQSPKTSLARLTEPGPYLLSATQNTPIQSNTRRIKSAHECGLVGAAMRLTSDSEKYLALSARNIPSQEVSSLAVVGAKRAPHLYKLKAHSTKDKCYFAVNSLGILYPTDLPSGFNHIISSTIRDLVWTEDGDIRTAPVELASGDYMLESEGRFYIFTVSVDP